MPKKKEDKLASELDINSYDIPASMQPFQYFSMFCDSYGWAMSLSKDKIFVFLFKLIQLATMNTNVVVLSTDVRARIRADLNISDVTYIALMKRLLSSDILVRIKRPIPNTNRWKDSKTEYMINPDYMWKGTPEYRQIAQLRFKKFLDNREVVEG